MTQGEKARKKKRVDPRMKLGSGIENGSEPGGFVTEVTETRVRSGTKPSDTKTGR